MADVGHEPDEAALAIVARHALHDEELIAAFATGSLDADDDTTRAGALVDRCVACRDLHRDLQAINGALAIEARSTMTAPRDFRLSEADARRLGGTITPRGVLTRLRRSWDSFLRPVGASLATLGFVGLLVGTVTFGAGAMAGAPTSQGGPAEATAAPGDMATAAPGAVEASRVPGQASHANSTDRATAVQSNTNAPSATAFSVAVDGGRDELEDAAPSPVSLLLGGSLVLVLLGLGMLLIAFWRRRTGRRGTQHP